MTTRTWAVWAATAMLLAAGCTSHSVAEDSTSSPDQTSTTEVTRDAPVPVVMRRDFQISYHLEGSTVSSPGLPLTPPVGMLWQSHDRPHTTVAAGAQIGKWKVDPTYRDSLAASSANNRIDAARLKRLGDRATAVTAPIAGTIGVSDGGDVSLVVAGIDVSVPVTGIQRLRLSAVPIRATATVETVVGQRTIKCDYVWIDKAMTGDETSDNVDLSGSLRCRLPQIVETAPGLRATLNVTSKVIKNAIVVPDVMLGQDTTGYTVTIVKDGQKATTPVDVGPSDGVVRVITSDLPVGATIVEPDQ